MSKELEVFKKISKSHERMAYHFNPHLDKWDENYMICINENWEEELDIIKKALTPPTEKEVCKALNEYFGFNFYYQNNSFYRSDGIKFIYLLKVGGFTEIQLYDGHLPPHLTTLIGRFYEGGKNE